MKMATPRAYFAIRLIQWRRRVARQRMLRDMGWRSYWAQVQTRRYT